MATNQSSAAQERQLILMERMNRRLDLILEGQMKLEEANGNLQRENTQLKNELAKQERVKMKSKRASKGRESRVEIPNDLKVKYSSKDLRNGFRSSVVAFASNFPTGYNVDNKAK